MSDLSPRMEERLQREEREREDRKEYRRRIRKVGCVIPECEAMVARSVPHPICSDHRADIWARVEFGGGLDTTSIQRVLDRRLAGSSPPLADEEVVTQEQAAERKAARQLRAAEGGTLYVLDSLNGNVKIGWTKALRQRMGQYPPGFRLIVTGYGTRADERDIHRSLKTSCAAGREWYEVTPEVVRFINTLIDAKNAAMPAWNEDVDRHNETFKYHPGVQRKHSTPLPPFVSLDAWDARSLRDVLDDGSKWKKRPSPKPRSRVAKV